MKDSVHAHHPQSEGPMKNGISVEKRRATQGYLVEGCETIEDIYFQKKAVEPQDSGQVGGG